jgi:hypothetical protein
MIHDSKIDSMPRSKLYKTKAISNWNWLQVFQETYLFQLHTSVALTKGEAPFNPKKQKKDVGKSHKRMMSYHWCSRKTSAPTHQHNLELEEVMVLINVRKEQYIESLDTEVLSTT